MIDVSKDRLGVILQIFRRALEHVLLPGFGYRYMRDFMHLSTIAAFAGPAKTSAGHALIHALLCYSPFLLTLIGYAIVSTGRQCSVRPVDLKPCVI